MIWKGTREPSDYLGFYFKVREDSRGDKGMSNAKLAKSIVEKVGGAKNITQVWHCITRLRFNIRDEKDVSLEEIKKLDGVLGVQFQSGQLQVIIGSEVANVFNEINALTAGSVSSEAGAPKSTNIVEKIFDVISGIFTPILAAITGAGLLKGIMAILAATNLLSAQSETYMVLSAISDAAFYFLPFLIAYSAANKFKTNASIAVSLAGVLMYPTFIQMAAAGEVKSLSFIGLTIPMNSYASSVVPIILGVWLLSYVEKYAKKIIPNSLSIVFVPLISLLITAPILLAFIAPLGSFVGVYLERILTTIFTVAGPIGGALLGGLMPLIVITGMHYAFFPAAFVSFQKFGYEMMLLPMNLVANLAQAGATLGVLIRTKDIKMKQVAFSALIPAFFGITEPAIYGVTMKLKKPFYASLIGAGLGGAVFAGFGVKAFSFTVPGILAYPTYIQQGTKNLMIAVLGTVLSFSTALILTLVLKFDLGESTSAVAETVANSSVASAVKSDAPSHIMSPMSGELVVLSECPDRIFAEEMMGKGVGIIPDNGVVLAPFDGQVILTTPTNHAIGLMSNDGIELLIHVGLNTVNLKGEFFTLKVNQGDKVSKGDTILMFDHYKIKERGINLYSPIIVTNTTKYLDILTAKDNRTKVEAGADEILVVVS